MRRAALRTALRTVRRALAGCVWLLAGAGALAQPTTAPPPRETAAAVAASIRSLYFDAAKAAAIAARLDADGARGDFDALTDPRLLAAALTERLRPADAHFSVTFAPQTAPAARPPAAGPASGPGPGPGPAAPDGADAVAERRANFGFRKVELLPGNVGLIDMRHFADIDFANPADPARRAADAALDVVGHADAVIVDLRDNGGGAPSMVGYLVSAFTAAGAPIHNVFHSRDGTQSEAPAVPRPQPRLQVPLYLLTSGRTGSAAEALPYTLQAAKRATVVGEASAGAANPGGVVAVGGGFSVFVSQGSPRNPVTGGNWEGTGVRPDVDVAAAQALAHAHGLALRSVVAADASRLDAAWALAAMTPVRTEADLRPYVGAYGNDIAVEPDAAGQLRLLRGRRPPQQLASLGTDGLFTVAGDPGRRVHFLRDAAGAVTALDLLLFSGESLRRPRRR